ncbi:hypothetical protein ACFO26_00630 [Lactococcus nasutitermitis]|uniref:YcxB-like protein domain-containing protein n=1 Tax=Lactococcus nasutitermitis TaxID=1652957 RepID=A0ABV9JBF0_9LACT|nr:hypothetical protein [Lactococcus nasutitermitis]
MFYHFKGVLELEDYLVLMKRSLRMTQIVVSVILLAFAILNGFLQKNLIFSVIFGVLLIIAGNFYIQWATLGKFKKNFQAVVVDDFITKEGLNAQVALKRVQVLPESVYLFAGRNQVMIFKKNMLENQGQWEDFVKMVSDLAVEKKKGRK